MLLPVIPAQAGVHAAYRHGWAGDRALGMRLLPPSPFAECNGDSAWIPAFVGMTKGRVKNDGGGHGAMVASDEGGRFAPCRK